jgi:hypothetical protein
MSVVQQIPKAAQRASVARPEAASCVTRMKFTPGVTSTTQCKRLNVIHAVSMAVNLGRQTRVSGRI